MLRRIGAGDCAQALAVGFGMNDATPIALVRRVVCSDCGSVSARVRSSRELGVGNAKLCYYTCKVCGAKFRIIFDTYREILFRYPEDSVVSDNKA